MLQYKNEILHIDTVSLEELIKMYPTPFYIYSLSHIEKQRKRFIAAFDGMKYIICYAVKANNNTEILKYFAHHAIGADIVSGGELAKVLDVGINNQYIVYSGVGKTKEEIADALDAKILFFNVESKEELYTIAKIAKMKNTKAPIAIRVNPDVSPKTHPYIATGLLESKFGISLEEALSLYKEAAVMDSIEILGIDCHIGSQILELSIFAEVFEYLVALYTALQKEGITIRYIDIGGGLGIAYKREEVDADVEYYASLVRKYFSHLDVTIVFEPGRFLVGTAGVLITQVLYRKKNSKKEFIIVDTGMNDILRPALYDAYHDILPIKENNGPCRQVDIVGPVCESSDFLAKGREFPHVEQGEYLAICTAGAYGHTLSSEYNMRKKPREIVLIEGGSIIE
ncbi:MAG: diaminopimelate decarboxylase [Desulfovibrionaceae bacterium]